MIAKTKFFWFIFILNLPPSLLQALHQPTDPILNDVVSATNTNLLVVGDNNANTKQNQLPPNNLKTSEIIQQVDVKDAQNKVISNISNVIINNESDKLFPNVKPEVNLINNSLVLQNVDNNVGLNNTVTPKVNASTDDSINNIVTVNDSSLLLQNISLNGVLSNHTEETFKVVNVTVLAKNATNNASEEFKKPIDVRYEHTKLLSDGNKVSSNGSNYGIENIDLRLSIQDLNNGSQDNITNNLVISNATISVEDGRRTGSGNNLSSLVNVSNKTENQTYITVPNNVGNSSQLLLTNSSYLDVSPRNVVPINNDTDIKTINHNDDNSSDIAWRSLVPLKKNKDVKLQHNLNLEIKNVSLVVNNSKNNNKASNDISVESLNNKNDSAILNIKLNDGYYVTPLNKTLSEVPKTKRPINIDSLTDNSKDNNISNFANPINAESNSNPSNIFMIVNSGNIEGFRTNLPTIDSNPSNKQIANTDSKPNNSKINNDSFNLKDSKLIDAIINSTLNNVASSILDQNIDSYKSNNLFLILNSGSISNFQLNSPVSDVLKNDLLDIDKSKKSKDKSVLFKQSSVKSLNPVLDIKFRTGLIQDASSNKNTSNNSSTVKPSNIQLNNQSLKVLPIEINDLQSNVTVRENSLDKEDNLSAEIPVFRSLIPHKNKTSVQAGTVLSTTSKFNLNNNEDDIEPLPESASNNIELDFNNLNLIGNAIDLLKRWKRSTKGYKKGGPKYFWEIDNEKAISNKIDIDKIVSKQNRPNRDNTKLLNNYILFNLLKPSRRYSDYSGNDNNAETDDTECPLSILAKLAFYHLLEALSKKDSAVISKIYSVIMSLLEGNENAINVVSYLLWDEPFSVNLRLQLLHGDTNDFIVEFYKYLHLSLCNII